MEKAKRTTKLKKEILELLQEHHLLSAMQIVEKLHQRGHQVNKTSVYRNLEAFLEDELICQQTFGHDEFVYELQHSHHDHLYCTVCGKVTTVSCAVETPATLKGYAVDHHHLTLYGLCAECQKK